MRRIDDVERAVDIDLFKLVGEDHRGIAIGRDVARRDRQRQTLIGSIARLFHEFSRFGAVRGDVRAVTGQGREHLSRHAPDPFRGRLHRRADLTLAVADDVDERLAV